MLILKTKIAFPMGHTLCKVRPIKLVSFQVPKNRQQTIACSWQHRRLDAKCIGCMHMPVHWNNWAKNLTNHFRRLSNNCRYFKVRPHSHRWLGVKPLHSSSRYKPQYVHHTLSIRLSVCLERPHKPHKLGEMGIFLNKNE